MSEKQVSEQTSSNKDIVHTKCYFALVCGGCPLDDVECKDCHVNEAMALAFHIACELSNVVKEDQIGG